VFLAKWCIIVFFFFWLFYVYFNSPLSIPQNKGEEGKHMFVELRENGFLTDRDQYMVAHQLRLLEANQSTGDWSLEPMSLSFCPSASMVPGAQWIFRIPPAVNLSIMQ
jgi:hypothetical protein